MTPDYGCAVYRYEENTAVFKVTVLYTVGLLNTTVYRPVYWFSISFRHGTIYFISSSQILVTLWKSLHVERSAAGYQHTRKLQHKFQQHGSLVQRQKIYIINTYGKENWWEHSRWCARLYFCRSCLRLMTSQNTAVYRYHGIFETVYYHQVFINTAHPYTWQEYTLYA